MLLLVVKGKLASQNPSYFTHYRKINSNLQPLEYSLEGIVNAATKIIFIPLFSCRLNSRINLDLKLLMYTY